MADALRDGGPEPGGRIPAGPLYVPVRPGPRGCVARLFRAPGGHRTAVAFTTPARLAAALGREHRWVRLSASALRSLTAPLGCTSITIDPWAAEPARRRPSRELPAGSRGRGRTGRRGRYAAHGRAEWRTGPE
ncbi:hypothetical protein GCM10010420_40380 [Streptomyces glaucosporus]|uniref:SseB protein N-terminal domain-containing protein n=1 Tax=Streptomyces glaucosporus TaxID=284044 RepID=A0ABN3ILE4_9ACTN